ncbi:MULTISPECIES: rRNA adenine N-6-methyltransferase family protein [unclassified Streptomyces]|uniref:rRNA adenine N-6-methyltransferase family protein n=1 Tax=unclassified Streptomyces TaxID=2593676 RepID=UPI002E2C947B|nr:rRNA adenine N-6-methyltransferase family protein [Streptomyces sp. NBC_00223]
MTRQPHEWAETPPPSVVPVSADLLARAGFDVRSDLGQHFLRSKEAARRLLDCAELPERGQVLEIGAGLGTLSEAVAETGHWIWAVEKDRRLEGILQAVLRPFGRQARVSISDVREVDLHEGLGADTVLLAIMPFDWELSAALTRHVFATTPKVARGLVVVPSRTLEKYQVAGEEAGGLRLREVDGISRFEFWPKAPEALRVVSIERRQ